MKTIYETYIEEICSNCKNREESLCNIRRNVKGNLQCIYYEKEKEKQGYKEFKNRTANQKRPIMKNIM